VQRWCMAVVWGCAAAVHGGGAGVCSGVAWRRFTAVVGGVRRWCEALLLSLWAGPVRFTPGGKAVLAEVADHVCYIRDQIGAEHVGIGGDYDGCTDLPVGLEDVSKCVSHCHVPKWKVSCG
jgi:microsomal dipeptidase-like Zn-dependent dipeptidase